MNKNKTLFQLAWPLFFEIAFMMMFGVVDTMMLSRYSDFAVAAVGISNNVLNFVVVFLNVVVAGVAVVIAQNLGANKEEKAKEISNNAVLLNVAIGMLISLVLTLFHVFILNMMNTPAELFADARAYIIILGSTIFINSLIGVSGAILRAYGHTKVVMKISIFSNIINIIGNYILIFGAFGLPSLGVSGAAISTLLSRVVLLVVAFAILHKTCGIHLFHSLKIKPNKENTRAIFKIGLPRALENFSYNFAQLIITSFVALIGAEMLTARVYINNITMFSYLVTLAIGQAAQIKIGYLVGENNMKEAHKQGVRAGIAGAISSLFVITLIYLNYEVILSLLTDNANIIAMAKPILFVCIFLELGRSANIIIISILTGAGDATFPVVMAIISMWGLAVCLSYVLGIHMGYGLLGIFIASAVDECFRGFTMWWRWQSKVWMKKRLLTD
ncbi:MAG: MATE family efflux transporter [Erysipelotrichaceae bacterium]